VNNLPQILFSPYLTPCDFYAFSQIKDLRGSHFEDTAEIVLQDVACCGFQKYFELLEHRQKYVAAEV
jgi:hypothetical protein